MKILVAYGTTEGQTRKIAEFVAEQLQAGGNDAQLHDSDQITHGLKVDDFDAVVATASVHQGVHQESMTDFIVAHFDQLQNKPTLFLSVSLSAAFDEGKPEARAYVDRFIAETGWRPTRIGLVAGALRYSEYDYFKEQIIRHIVLRGRDVADTNGDHELTDWDDLSRQVTAFVQAIG